jgi:hypothetical protein
VDRQFKRQVEPATSMFSNGLVFRGLVAPKQV